MAAPSDMKNHTQAPSGHVGSDALLGDWEGRDYYDFLDDLDRDQNVTDEDLPGACGITGVPTHPPTREENAGPAIGGMPASGRLFPPIVARPQVPYDQTPAGKAAIERVRRIARDWSFK